MKNIQNAVVILGFFFLFSAGGLYAEERTVSELFEISFAYESQGNYAESLNSVLQIIRKNTKNYTANLRAGWLFYMKGNFQDSVVYYRNATALTPGAIEPLEGMMLPLMAMKLWSDAEKTAHDIKKIDEQNYRANSRLAYILFSQARYSEAKSAYEAVLKRYPSDLDMKLGIAWTYLRMGNVKKAKEYFDQVLEIRRNNPNALAGLEEVQKMK